MKINSEETTETCEMCGVCCKIFLINLNEPEYNSAKYKTVFGDTPLFDDFSEAEKYGANFLDKKKDGDCIYLDNNICSIHEKRPQVCRDFFCASKKEAFREMKNAIKLAKGRLGK